jgi:lipopolysaccharide export system protein LptA
MYRKWVKFVVIFLLLGNPIAYALPTDKEQIIHVDADTADLNQLTHRGIYTGHIKFNQGTTNLHAEKAITQGNDKNELILAIAEGNATKQAHYWTQTAVDKPLLHAFANTIRYHAQTHIIDLIGNAKITQGENSFAAPTIRYNTVKQQVISKNDGSNRTTIILYPEKKKT